MNSDGYGNNSNVPGHPQQQLQQQQDPELGFQYIENQPQQFQNLNQQSNLNIQPSAMAMPGIQPHTGNFLQHNLITGSSNCSTLKRSYPNGVQEQNFSKFQRTENQQVFNNGDNTLLNNENQVPDFTSDFAAMTAQQLKLLMTVMSQSFEDQVLLQNQILVEMLMERFESMDTRAKQRHDEIITMLNRLEAEKAGPCVTKWSNEEVVSLIDVRKRMENEFSKADGKEVAGLWEKLSVEMEKKGFIKDAKKCKEKWENITKYYTKKMKEESQGKMTTTTKKCCYIELLRDHYAQKPPGVDINKVDHQSKANSEKDGDDNQL